MPGLEPPTVITAGYGGALAGRNSEPTSPFSRTAIERTAGSITISLTQREIVQLAQTNAPVRLRILPQVWLVGSRKIEYAEGLRHVPIVFPQEHWHTHLGNQYEL